MKPRQRQIIKTPKPYLKPKCKTYFIKITSIDGSRRQINLCTSDKKEARIRARREVDLINKQMDGTFSKVVTLDEMIASYFTSKVNLAPSTMIRNKQHMEFFKKFMQMQYSNVKYFNQINHLHIGEFQTYRLESTGNGKMLSPKTVKESLFVLNNMFEWALRSNYIHTNPVKKIVKLKCPRIAQHYFEETEVLLILHFCQSNSKYNYLYAPFLTLATCGFRSGELTNLLWSDIDFERKQIKIHYKILPDGTPWATKTGQNREVKMDDEVYRVLLELKERSASPWVFLNSKGDRQTSYMLWEHLGKMCSKLGLKRGQVHSFRRTFAKMMDLKIKDRVVIQKTLGHSTMTMTDLYCGSRAKDFVDMAHMETTTDFIKKLKDINQMSQ
jgi:integrase/recombinase XerD